jgi:addiction module HigA family antidote
MSKSSTTTKVPAYRLVPPGSTLREEIELRGLSVAAFAAALGVSPARISSVLMGKGRISPEMAVRLSAFFGGSAEFWTRLQAAYDVAVVETARGARIRREVRRAA